MNDLPILFSAPMVRALLDGRKTQTRRVLKPQPEQGFEPWQTEGGEWFLAGVTSQTPLSVRFRKGDRLWVREAWRCNGWATDVATIFYRASEGDGYTATCEQWPVADHKPLRVETKWSPSLHLPRWASRLTLTVTDVRVQRLQEISHTDAMAEGLEWVAPTWGISGIADSWQDDPRMAYRALWDAINGKGAADANPWIVALTFAVERRNIDAARAA